MIYQNGKWEKHSFKLGFSARSVPEIGTGGRLLEEVSLCLSSLSLSLSLFCVLVFAVAPWLGKLLWNHLGMQKPVDMGKTGWGWSVGASLLFPLGGMEQSHFSLGSGTGCQNKISSSDSQEGLSMQRSSLAQVLEHSKCTLSAQNRGSLEACLHQLRRTLKWGSTNPSPTSENHEHSIASPRSRAKGDLPKLVWWANMYEGEARSVSVCFGHHLFWSLQLAPKLMQLCSFVSITSMVVWQETCSDACFVPQTLGLCLLPLAQPV